MTKNKIWTAHLPATDIIDFCVDVIGPETEEEAVKAMKEVILQQRDDLPISITTAPGYEIRLYVKDNIEVSGDVDDLSFAFQAGVIFEDETDLDPLPKEES